VSRPAANGLAGRRSSRSIGSRIILVRRCSSRWAPDSSSDRSSSGRRARNPKTRTSDRNLLPGPAPRQDAQVPAELHPFVLHFAVGLLVAAPACDAAGLLFHREGLLHASRWTTR